MSYPTPTARPVNPDDAAPTGYEHGEAAARAGEPFDLDADAVPAYAEGYREGYESVRLALPDPAAAGAVSPAEHRAEAVEADGALVLAHLLAVGVSFNARQKVGQAETYTMRHGGASLAVPSKLSHTTAFQADAEAVETAAAGARFYPTTLYRAEDVQGRSQIVVLAETVPGDRASLRAVGFLQDKHARWIAPLLDGTVPVGRASGPDCPVRVYVTAVTGGTPDRPTRGVNVAICGAADAVRAAYDDAAREAAQERAYHSGDPVAVEAAI